MFSHDANAASRSREWALYITTSENNTEAEERYSKEAEREAGLARLSQVCSADLLGLLRARGVCFSTFSCERPLFHKVNRPAKFTIYANVSEAASLAAESDIRTCVP